MAKCSCERVLQVSRFMDNKPTILYCDNQSSIKLGYNPVFHEKSKHFEINYHFTRQEVQCGTIKVEYISSQEQPADFLTKLLGRQSLKNAEENFTFTILISFLCPRIIQNNEVIRYYRILRNVVSLSELFPSSSNCTDNNSSYTQGRDILFPLRELFFFCIDATTSYSI